MPMTTNAHSTTRIPNVPPIWKLPPSLRPEIPLRRAILDVGSNSIQLAIYEVETSGAVQISDRFKESPRLGQELDENNILGESTLNKITEIVRRAALVAKDTPIYAIGTQALRQARNGIFFCNEIQKKTGIAIQIISGQEEARLVNLGAWKGMPRPQQQRLLLDIGGGSAEIVFSTARHVNHSESLKLGAVALTRRFLPNGVSNAGVTQLLDYTRSRVGVLSSLPSQIGFAEAILTSGTGKLTRTLAYTLQGLAVPNCLHGLTLTKDEIALVRHALLQSRTEKELKSLPGMDLKRWDTILAGVLTLETVTLTLGVAEWVISETALREGALVDFLEREGFQQNATEEDIRWQSVEALGKLFSRDLQRDQHVCQLATTLYDSLKPIHKLSLNWRHLLRAASFLCHVGLCLEHNQFHKHGHYLISHSSLAGHSLQERKCVAAIVRYHRKRLPRLGDEELAGLSDDDCTSILRCAALVRLANDISKLQEVHVQDVELNDCNTKHCRFRLYGNNHKPIVPNQVLPEDTNSHFKLAFGCHPLFAQ